MKNAIKTIKTVFPYTIPVLAGYLFLGIAYGIMIVDKGYSFWWAGLMSIIIFGGTSQIMGVGFLVPGFSLAEVALMTLMVNIRYFFFSISLLDKYNRFGKKRWLMIYSLADETYSLVSTLKVPDDINEESFYLALSLMNMSYWVGGSLLGALLGGFIPFDTSGIEFSMIALFIVSLVEQCLNKKARIPAAVGGTSTIICFLIFGPDSFVPISLVVITLILVIGRKKLEVTDNAD